MTGAAKAALARFAGFMKTEKKGKRRKFRIDELPNDQRRAALKAFNAIPITRRKVRAYFDANIPANVARRIRAKLHWDVLSAQANPNLRNRDDQFHYSNSRQLQRILFTLDKGFLDDHRFPLHQSPGVCVLEANQEDENDIFFAIVVASATIRDAYRRVPDLFLQSKVKLTLEGQKLRYITKNSEIHELFSPH